MNEKKGAASAETCVDNGLWGYPGGSMELGRALGNASFTDYTVLLFPSSVLHHSAPFQEADVILHMPHP